MKLIGCSWPSSKAGRIGSSLVALLFATAVRAPSALAATPKRRPSGSVIQLPAPISSVPRHLADGVQLSLLSWVGVGLGVLAVCLVLGIIKTRLGESESTVIGIVALILVVVGFWVVLNHHHFGLWLIFAWLLIISGVASVLHLTGKIPVPVLSKLKQSVWIAAILATAGAYAGVALALHIGVHITLS